MKTKTLLIIAVVALVTLSFTFASKKAQVKTAPVAKESNQESIGGFVSEDKF